MTEHDAADPADLFSSDADHKPKQVRSVPQRVLVVDDSQMMRQAVCAIVQSAGYETVEACDGAAALKAVLHQCPDLVLLDVQMPGMNGIEVLESLRVTPGCQDLPVVLLTVLQDAEIARLAAKHCVRDYLSKPAHPAQLKEKIQKHLA